MLEVARETQQKIEKVCLLYFFSNTQRDAGTKQAF